MLLQVLGSRLPLLSIRIVGPSGYGTSIPIHSYTKHAIEKIDLSNGF